MNINKALDTLLEIMKKADYTEAEALRMGYYAILDQVSPEAPPTVKYCPYCGRKFVVKEEKETEGDIEV